MVIGQPDAGGALGVGAVALLEPEQAAVVPVQVVEGDYSGGQDAHQREWQPGAAWESGEGHRGCSIVSSAADYLTAVKVL
ncbi:hypothetical protein D3C84_1034420 [compost metagenome]